MTYFALVVQCEHSCLPKCDLRCWMKWYTLLQAISHWLKLKILKRNTINNYLRTLKCTNNSMWLLSRTKLEGKNVWNIFPFFFSFISQIWSKSSPTQGSIQCLRITRACTETGLLASKLGNEPLWAGDYSRNP